MATKAPIAWATASRVGARVASSEPFSASYLAVSMTEEFDRLTAEAEGLVVAATGLQPSGGPARSRVIDRPQWAQLNVRSMERLVSPVLSQRSDQTRVSAAVGRQITGAELGAVLGWMSSRVLGQYDQLIDARSVDSQDFIYYVAPNVLALEKRYGFPPGEFRLWLALHECTHRAQFMGVPWLTEFFLEQIHTLLASSSNTQSLVTSVHRAFTDKGPHSAALSVLASPEQREALDRLMGLMALLEGHAEVVMDRAAGDRLPSAERFHRVLHERRTGARGLHRVISRLLGMEAKMQQYAQGALFMRTVEQHGGAELFSRVWQQPSSLPTATDIAQPQQWIERMASAPPVS